MKKMPAKTPRPASDLARHILVPLDFSEVSLDAVKYAVKLARLTDARLTLLYVHDGDAAALGVSHALEGHPAPLSAIKSSVMEAYNAKLERLAGEAAQGIKVSHDVAWGTPHKVIARMVKSLDADTLVMGSHGRAGLERFMLGSVTERVLRSVNIPIIVIKPSP
ncbi:MAG: TRAP-T-associated universal stress protein TeaD [Myxococcota bacterium]|nr:TRAP-T-associated universal stress protein TeaD [Myxococcota bacterium]